MSEIALQIFFIISFSFMFLLLGFFALMAVKMLYESTYPIMLGKIREYVKGRNMELSGWQRRTLLVLVGVFLPLILFVYVSFNLLKFLKPDPSDLKGELKEWLKK